MGSLLVAVALGAALVLLLLKWKSKKRITKWEDYGISTLKIESIAVRSMKNASFREGDVLIYKQMKDLQYGGFHETDCDVIFVKDLEIAKHIFVKDFDHFVNRRNLNQRDRMWTRMMQNKQDDEWRGLRHKMTPTFTSGKIRRMFPLMIESSNKLANFVAEQAKVNSGDVNLQEALGRFAMDVICSAAFGLDSGIFKNFDSEVAHQAIDLQMVFTPFAMFRIFLSELAPTWFKLLDYSFVKDKPYKFFNNILKSTIKTREETGQKANDFLQLLIDVKNGKLAQDSREDSQFDTYEKDAALSKVPDAKEVDFDDDAIVANAILFIFGGFDTTKTALTWIAHAMATNPDIQKRLREELQEACDEKDAQATYDILNTHEYLEKVVNESLRLHSPAVRIDRLCTKDYQIPNTDSVIPKGALVWIPIFAIHRDEQYFPDPTKFDPERFSREGKASRHPYAYMPFGHGPRNCIGNRFALMQIKSALVSLLMKFDIEPCAKTVIPPTFKNNFFLQPADDVWVKLTPLK